MFNKITPEQAGVSSKTVKKFVELLEKRGATTHGLLMMKGNEIFFEGYWKPFHREFCHRMYSQTKSFVSIAIGLLEEDGKLCLTDKIVDYFPDKIDGEISQYLQEQTIEEMLTMCTCGFPSWWLSSKDNDRTHLYLNEMNATRASGTLWAYDTAGTQVLCSLVERLAGMPLLEYLKIKLFNAMGMFQTATMLQTANGDSWGDSAMVCTLRDVASFALLLMQEGIWEGQRLINSQYVKMATSRQVDNRENGYYDPLQDYGYGYQIWRLRGDGFALVGMGDQLVLCYPEKQLLFACMSDNQGAAWIRKMIIIAFEEMILDNMGQEPLPSDLAGQTQLTDMLNHLILRSVKGMADSTFRTELNGKEYICESNPMGITRFSFVFNDETMGDFYYTNAQGEKKISFGVNQNVFGKFPQLGYPNEYGNVSSVDGFMYDDAVSFAWLEEKKLMLHVQIIDRYLGNMSAIFAFKGEDVFAKFTAVAEGFLYEYKGALVAHAGGNKHRGR